MNSFINTRLPLQNCHIHLIFHLLYFYNMFTMNVLFLYCICSFSLYVMKLLYKFYKCTAVVSMKVHFVIIFYTFGTMSEQFWWMCVSWSWKFEKWINKDHYTNLKQFAILYYRWIYMYTVCHYSFNMKYFYTHWSKRRYILQQVFINNMQFVQLTKNEKYCLELKFIFLQKFNQPLLPFLALFLFLCCLRQINQ